MDIDIGMLADALRFAVPDLRKALVSIAEAADAIAQAYKPQLWPADGLQHSPVLHVRPPASDAVDCPLCGCPQSRAMPHRRSLNPEPSGWYRYDSVGEGAAVLVFVPAE